MYESKWIFVPDVIIFHPGISEVYYWQEQDGYEVKDLDFIPPKPNQFIL